MSKAENYKQFAQNLVTTGDLYRLLDDVREAEAASSESGSSHLSRKLKGKVDVAFEELLEKLEKKKSIPPSQEGRVEYFRGLSEYLHKLPNVKIELAFEPSEEFVNKMSKYIRSGSEDQILLDISVKLAILAGATIESNGIFKDYSYSDKLDEVIKQKSTTLI